MIGGLILLGPDPAQILFRAIGPSLVASGIQSALPDPRLDLFDAQGVTIATNNNWRDSQEAQIKADGLAPTNDLESAIDATLPDAHAGMGLIHLFHDWDWPAAERELKQATGSDPSRGVYGFYFAAMGRPAEALYRTGAKNGAVNRQQMAGPAGRLPVRRFTRTAAVSGTRR